MKTAFRVSTLVWAGMILGSLAAAPARAQDAGAIVAWGRNLEHQCNVPTPNSGFVAVAAGITHSLGLKFDGSILAWGDNGPGLPTPNSGFIAVAAGTGYSLGLKNDGSIVAWGRNDYGQCSVPTPNSGFVAVAGGESHSLGVKADGSIVAWGFNEYGKCNVPSPNSGFVAVAAGQNHSLGLRSDGFIVAWGNYSQSSVPIPNSGFVAIAAGRNYSLGLKADGSIVAWGDNYYGSCNIPAPNSSFVAVAAEAGGVTSLGLKADGSIVAWGFNGYGQCNVPTPNSGFVAVAGGGSHSLGLKALPPIITGQPVSYTCCAGQAAFFTVAAVGAPCPSYQWCKGGEPIIGATAATLTINPAGPNDAGNYDVVVTNSYGAATSDAATLTVNTAPTITTEPQSQTTCEGQSVTFSVATGGTPPPVYQWHKDGQPISGAVSSDYTVYSLAPADAGAYDVVVSNSCGSIASDPAILTVRSAPSITEQPAGGTVGVAQPAVLSTLASGWGVLSYEWQKDGVPLTDGGRISGATSSTLTISPTWMSDSGSYDVVVTNDCGMVTSETATLTVTGLRGDLSCDGTVGFGDINPFVLALTSWDAYLQQYPNCNIYLADINGDEHVNFADINPFVALLSGGGTP